MPKVALMPCLGKTFVQLRDVRGSGLPRDGVQNITIDGEHTVIFISTSVHHVASILARVAVGNFKGALVGRGVSVRQPAFRHMRRSTLLRTVLLSA
jgi:hypothetical protein